VLWLGQVAVATLPVEIDLANADQVREDLLTVLNRGPARLIVDMAGTTFCDSAGVNALVRAYQRAEACGARMQLVVSVPAVQRVLAITGVDYLIGTCPSVAAALVG
jgi:anti-anti-sigma factor